jgi:hypothetical protein
MADETIIIDDRIFELSFSPVCHECSRLDLSGKTCEAFPNGIPDIIWEGKNNHQKPYKGDLGILFKQITEKELTKRDKAIEAMYG